jgi:hypothetical protein
MSLAATMIVTLGLGATPAIATGPPSPGPYPKQELQEGGPTSFYCTDTDGTVLYDGSAWTLEPLVRGPGFAPVVLYLREAGNVPVVPLEFTLFGYPVWWWYDPDGANRGGEIFSAYGRPQAYGSLPTDTAPRVTCWITMFGYYNWGGYRMTPTLAGMLGLPDSVIGRTIYFDNEGAVQFQVLRYLFPLTAHVVHPTLPTPDRTTYSRTALPQVTCRTDAGVSYRGAAYTLDPLVRGYKWAPIAFWLDGDRLVTPQWFRSTVTGTWQTVDSGPARQGTLDATTQARPRGYGGRPNNATSGNDCRWSGSHHVTTRVTTVLAGQLGLPASLVGRRVELAGTYVTHAYAPNWLFPPLAGLAN